MGVILGFGAHRAGLCTVKAAVEIVSSRQAFFLWSFIKGAIWVVAITALAGALGHATTHSHWPLTLMSVFGGVLFGVGAAVNGSCTLSTLTHAVDGNLGLWVTVAAWPAGMWIAFSLPLAHPTPVVVPQTDFPLPVLLLLCLAMLAESVYILRRFWRKHPVRKVLGASVYTLSAGAALIGISNAIIVELTGVWSYSSTIQCSIGVKSGSHCTQQLLAWAIVAAAILGMALSSAQRGSFKLVVPSGRLALRHAAAGLLMGAGTVMIPGGNDSLLLFAIPSMSPHAIPAYAGIFAGIFLMIALMRLSGKQTMVVRCNGDICKMQ